MGATLLNQEVTKPQRSNAMRQLGDNECRFASTGMQDANRFKRKNRIIFVGSTQNQRPKQEQAGRKEIRRFEDE